MEKRKTDIKGENRTKSITLLANRCVPIVEYVSAAGTGVSRGTLTLSDWDCGARHIRDSLVIK